MDHQQNREPLNTIVNQEVTHERSLYPFPNNFKLKMNIEKAKNPFNLATTSTNFNKNSNVKQYFEFLSERLQNNPKAVKRASLTSSFSSMNALRDNNKQTLTSLITPKSIMNTISMNNQDKKTNKITFNLNKNTNNIRETTNINNVITTNNISQNHSTINSHKHKLSSGTSLYNENSKSSQFKNQLEKIIRPYQISEIGNIHVDYDQYEEDFLQNDIKTNLTHIDKFKIYNGLKKNKINNPMRETLTLLDTQLDLNTLIKRNNSKSMNPEYKDHYYFNDPISSYKTLKINKQICDIALDKLLTTQINSYKEVKDSIKFNQSQISKIKKIKVIANLNKNKNDKKKDNKENDITEALDNKYNIGSVSKFNNYYRDMQFSNLELKAIYFYNNKTKPSSRADFTMSLFNQYIYIVGGYNTERLLEIWVCDLKHNCDWIYLQPEGEQINPRMGHSCVIYKGLMYIFGGNIKKNSLLPKEDIALYSIIEKCYNKFDGLWRRNHIAEAVGFHMFVFGGINEQNDFLSDNLILDMNTFRWLKILTKGDRPGRLAYMSSAVVLLEERKQYETLNLYKLPELSNKNAPKNFKYEGIYIFGGLNNEGEVNNDLRVLRIGRKPLTWINLNTRGIKPEPRYACSMNFNEDSGWLIIHGGKNDKSGDMFFNDTFIIDLLTFTWYEVNIIENDPLNRAQHNSIIHNNKLIIFGGCDTDYFHSSQLYVISLNYQEKKRVKLFKEEKIPNYFSKKNITQFEGLAPRGYPYQLKQQNSDSTDDKNKKGLISPKSNTNKSYFGYIQRLKDAVKKEMNKAIVDRNKKKMEEEVETKYGKITNFNNNISNSNSNDNLEEKKK